MVSFFSSSAFASLGRLSFPSDTHGGIGREGEHLDFGWLGTRAAHDRFLGGVDGLAREGWMAFLELAWERGMHACHTIPSRIVERAGKHHSFARLLACLRDLLQLTVNIQIVSGTMLGV